MSNEWRIGGGMQLKNQDDSVIYGPWRDPNAPREPKKVDSAAGLMEWDDSIRNLQLGEGAEEVIWVDDGKLLLPDLLEGSPVEERVLNEYREVAEAGTVVPEGLEVEYVDSSISVPETEEIWEFGGYRTGVTEEVTKEDKSYELLNFLEIDVPDSAVPYDLEHWEEGEGLVHPDRPVYEIDVETGEAVLYTSGEKVYDGDVSGMLSYLEEEWGEKIERPASTVKVQAALRGGGWDRDEELDQSFL